MHQIYYNSPTSTWLGGGALAGVTGITNVYGDLTLDPAGKVFYRTTDYKMNCDYYESGSWYNSNMDLAVPYSFVNGGGLAITDNASVYYRGPSNTIRRAYYKSQCFTTPSPNFGKNLMVNAVDSPEVQVDLRSSDLLLYPNPALYKVIVESKEMIDGYAIYNMSGELILQRDHVDQLLFEFIVEELREGMYFAQVRIANGQVISKKFVVSH
jgi:hypothetical protein